MLNLCFFFFFNDTATTEIYTLSLHDALPIFQFFPCTGKNLRVHSHLPACSDPVGKNLGGGRSRQFSLERSEEHTSELQSRLHLVCPLLLEKKKMHTDYELSEQPVFLTHLLSM